MELAELTAYAEEKYQMVEQHKWRDFPGFSVLTDPESGQWVALLMRQWDTEAGEETQRCDLKCGQQVLGTHPEAWLGKPFRMKGENWVGIRMTAETDPETVFRLLDRAMGQEEQRGYLVVLENGEEGARHGNVELPEAWRQVPAAGAEKIRQIPGVFTASTIPKSQEIYSGAENSLPEKIRQMMRMYTYGDGSFAEKCENFYRQGKFMEDYEDDAPWSGAYSRYFVTYHDLNPRQLRGYFTWRTRIRQGKYEPMTTSLAYLYVYELLNGIGTESPEDSLRKMEAFERGFLDSGVGDPEMRRNLRRWMRDLAVVKNLEPETARKYMDPADLRRDAALRVLENPEQESDEDVFAALAHFMTEKTVKSPVIQKHGERGRRLFARLWKQLRLGGSTGNSAFTACFGTRKTFAWYPMANAVYRWEGKEADRDYPLTENRVIRCRDGEWFEERYDGLYFDAAFFGGMTRGADRLFRQYLKTGGPLKPRAGEDWVKPWAEAVIAADREAEMEKARPKITIDLSGLDRIREDAASTRDSLLAAEEMDAPIQNAAERPSERLLKQEQPDGNETMARQGTKTAAEEAEGPRQAGTEKRTEQKGAQAREETGERKEISFLPGLDEIHMRILRGLLDGKSVDGIIRGAGLMPSIVADTINEALMDEIGDSVVESQEDGLELVEDYREELERLIGSK